ncbi:MAG: DUF917 family protein [Acidisphaera sp.]|nr:DUF917 family protein [Acidisphaera sp.]
MARILTEQDVEAAVLGGSVFAAGGGGFADHGRQLGAAAVLAGRPELVGMEEVPDDAWIATAAAIGAPGGLTQWEMLPVDYVRSVELLQQALGARLHGLMIGQNGRSSTLNGWLPAVMLGLKVVDAVGDVRAHPTGDMGSIGLFSATEPTIQTAAGGRRADHRYMELVVRGPVRAISPVLRAAANEAGGFIASCRNPVRADYVRANAALGGIGLALALGHAILAARARGASVLDAICRQTQGEVIGDGLVTENTVAYTSSAFDIGTIALGEGVQRRVLHVMNEYMAVQDGVGEQLAAYPDVIATLDPSGEPISAGQSRPGLRLLILRIAKTHLPLAPGLRDPALYEPVRQALGIDLVPYATA